MMMPSVYKGQPLVNGHREVQNKQDSSSHRSAQAGRLAGLTPTPSEAARPASAAP